MVYKFEFVEMESNKQNGFEIDFESESSVCSQLFFQGFMLNSQGNILVIQQRSVQGLLASELIDIETYELITYRIFNKLKRFITLIK